MTPEQTRLIRQSWDAVTPIADAAAQLFYQRLFEIEPDIRPLFADTDMAAQRGKLIDALSLVVENADRVEDLLPFVQDLGRRHVGYGVQDRHYEAVGAALLWTLERGLGDAFTAAVRDAWAGAYGVLSTAMRQAARDMTASAA